MDTLALAQWIIETYTGSREFVRMPGRSKPWIFRCGYCQERFSDENLAHYWYRDDVNLPFCSEVCARSAPVPEEVLNRIQCFSQHPAR